jgi:hypothetical protein
MKKNGYLLHLIGFILGMFFLHACAAERTVETVVPVPSATAPVPTPTPFIEERFIEVEWPSNLRLGDSDIIRLALIPSANGYTAQVEYPEHTVEVEDVEVPYLAGYEAVAIARLDAVGVDVQPTGNQAKHLVKGESLTWRWTIFPQSAGRHRLGLSLTLHWDPLGEGGRTTEYSLWQTGLEIIVNAPFGLTAPQARALGIAGILVGGVLVLPLAEFAARRRLMRVRVNRMRLPQPNKDLILELSPNVVISETERNLLQALFENYSRVVVETRFSSGYSGARTLLVQPFRSDGRADAHTIVKFAPRRMIQAEYANYQNFVRQTLPPITGRILGLPVGVRGEEDAAIQYTFVGTPSSAPVSLRTFALEQPVGETARLIEERLFSTFGPAWWMQRRPYVFRLNQEYDRLLPVHLLLQRAVARPNAKVIAGDLTQIKALVPGDTVRIEGAMVSEVRAQRRTATLTWPAFPGGSSLRVRFLDIQPASFAEGRRAHGIYGRVVASRLELMKEEVVKAVPAVDLNSDWISIGSRKLVNPLKRFQDLLHYQIQGTRSVIHGDLNLENVLVGPGDLVWLIDFASTREGHTLYDFARMEVELTTQVVAVVLSNQGLRAIDFIDVLQRLDGNAIPLGDSLEELVVLLNAVRNVARRCFYDPENPGELRKALVLAYLGCLKFSNLDEMACAPMPKALAFLAAAYLMGIDSK